jgi:hypothetical protein
MENQSIYKESFRKLIENSAADYYIGTGNPNAKILFVGQEGSCEQNDNEISLASNWKREIDKNELPNFVSQKPLGKNGKFARGHTWNLYQKLHDEIFQKNIRPVDNGVNFEQNIFTTELNVVNRGKIHAIAKKHSDIKQSVSERKDFFRTADFIQEFPVVVIACFDRYYITPDEFKEIFGVTWQDDNPCCVIDKSQNRFYGHFNENKSKLLIHTSQLSGCICTKLLNEMGLVIRNFLWQTDDKFRWENGGEEMYEKIQSNPEVLQSAEYKDMDKLGKTI